MKKNIFICHRPYHILRCCDMISRYHFDEYNVLITFDVKKAGVAKFQRFDSNKIFYSDFNEVVEMERIKVPSLKYFYTLVKCCKERRKRFAHVVEKYSDADSIFFFCDNELEIQLLVGLFLEESKKDLYSCLIDEGLVTYSDYTYNASLFVKLYSKFLKLFLGLKYFNISWAYGNSDYYNHSFANVPERAKFKKPIGKLYPLLDSTCARFRNKIGLNNILNRNKYFLYISQPFRTLEEEEMDILISIKDILFENDISFYIKIHPMQDESKFINKFGKQCVIEKSYPVELFYGENAIIGGTASSSLFNASLQGCKVMDISPLFDAPVYSIISEFNWIDVQLVDSIDTFTDLIKSYK